MKLLSTALLLALAVSITTGAFAQQDYTTDDYTYRDSIDIQVDIQRNQNYYDNDAWVLEIKNGDVGIGVDTSSIDTSGVTLNAMGSREVVLGKVFLKVVPWDIYEVVAYTNEMDLDCDGTPDLPSNWGEKDKNQKQDFIDKHAGLQNQNAEYLDDEGFNSYLYGAALKVRSEGIHGYAVSDNDGKIGYDNNGTPAVATLNDNDSVPAQLWDGKEYPAQVQFSPVPELAVEALSDQLLGNPEIRPIASAMQNSPLKDKNGSDNWLEMIFAASEKNTGSGAHKTKVYFDLRWN